MNKKLLVTSLILITAYGAMASGTTSRSAPVRRSTPLRSKPKADLPARKVSQPGIKRSNSFQNRAIYDTVSFYIRSKSTDGKFIMPEESSEDKAWQLAWAAGDPVVTDIAEGRKKVRRNFEGTLGADKTKHEVAVDFYLKGMGRRWKVDRSQVASVDGEERNSQ